MPLSAVQPERYSQLLCEKARDTAAILAPFAAPEPVIHASQPTAYRMRAEFRLWHEGDELDYVMYRRDDPSAPVSIRHFPVACERIQQLMPPLLEAIRANDVLRRKIFQAEFLSTLAGDTLVTLVYHRRLDEHWELEATALAEHLSISVVGRSRRQKVVIGREFVVERLRVEGRDFTYRQYEQSFTQPNARVNEAMLAWACARGAGCEGDLLELYCGNGNFTLPLSRHFPAVIATELSKTSVRAARENLEANKVSNVQIVRLSAAEVTQAMQGIRPFRRLADLPKPLSEFELNTLLVDPPRAGLDPETVHMARDFPNIIYISCNPESLSRNLETLCLSHRITHFALFDQFPYTHHMECGVFLQIK
jgi:tRNA (uracil-5-)-methyltransferase